MKAIRFLVSSYLLCLSFFWIVSDEHKLLAVLVWVFVFFLWGKAWQ